MSKKNVLVLSLSNNFSRFVSKQIADSLELFYVDLNDMLEYNMVNEQMLETAGRKYFDKQMQKTIKSVLDYENSLVMGDIELFLNNNNLLYFKKDFLIVYMFVKEDELEEFEKNYEFKRSLYAFDEEDEICKMFANVVIKPNIKEINFDEIKKTIQKKMEAKNENWW